MGRTACTEPQYLYSTAIPLLLLRAVRPVQNLSACTVHLYLYSLYGPYGLYRASVPVQRCPFALLTFTYTPLRCSGCIFVPSHFLLIYPIVLLNTPFFSTEAVCATSLNCKFSVNGEFILYSSFLL